MGHCAGLSFCLEISKERHKWWRGNANGEALGAWALGLRFEFFHGSDRRSEVLSTKNNVGNMTLKRQNPRTLRKLECFISIYVQTFFHSRLKNWKLCWVFLFLFCPVRQSEFCISSDRFWCPARVGPSPLRDCSKRPKSSDPGGVRHSNKNKNCRQE